jgi:hypothetical protein
MHLGRQMAEQKADPVMNGLGRDRMVVIQDQDKLCFNAVSSFSNSHQDRLNRGVAGEIAVARAIAPLNRVEYSAAR